MKILALDSALKRASAAILSENHVLGAASGEGSAALAVLAGRALAASGLAARDLDAVAATVGPGSFTGIRAGLALASGLALAAGIPVVGVSVAEAIAASLPDVPPGAFGEHLWVAIDSRRGHVFLDRAGELASYALASLPRPAGPVVLAGDAAEAVAPFLGAEARLAAVLLPDAAGVARAAALRLAGRLPPRASLPLYVDPPAALPAEGARPSPA
jgi:tRNA threonylcarbamoyladenosine biosynthesis protein TsaB